LILFLFKFKWLDHAQFEKFLIVDLNNP